MLAAAVSSLLTLPTPPTVWRTAPDLQPSAATMHIHTCAEEAIAERCPCLRLDAYAEAYPLPSFCRQPLAAGETALTGAPTVCRKN